MCRELTPEPPNPDFGGDRPRFKQLTDWLGPDFDGVIAFDEAHLMKNAAGTKRGSGEVNGTSSMRPAPRSTLPAG